MKALLFLLLPCSVFAFWVEGDYLAWFIKKNPEPVPLVTFAGADDDLPGALGQPNTRILLGKKSVGMGWLQGFEVSGGSWLNCCEMVGIEAGYLFLPKVTKKRSAFTSGQLGSPNLAVPIYDVTGVLGLGGVPGESIWVLPGPSEGEPFFEALFTERLSSLFQGAEINGLCLLTMQSQFSIDLVAGLRWLMLDEWFQFKGNTTTVPNTPFAQNSSHYNDRFHSINNYLAGQFGIKGQYRWRWLRIKALVKGSVGSTIEELKIKGSSDTITGTVWFNAFGAGESINGSIFAQPSNIGNHHKFPFSWGFETRVNSIFEITKNWGIDIGYSFLWISRVIRPANQIDRRINSTRTALAAESRATTGTGPGPIPFGTPGSAPAAEGPTAPTVHFKQSTFWAQGFNAGITCFY